MSGRPWQDVFSITVDAKAGMSFSWNLLWTWGKLYCAYKSLSRGDAFGVIGCVGRENAHLGVLISTAVVTK